MREFFRGWKRKMGVFTLVMACLTAVGWVRSMLTADMLELGHGNFDYELVSSAGSLRLTTKKWQLSNDPPDSPTPVVQQFRWTMPVRIRTNKDVMSVLANEKHRDFPGVSFGQLEWPAPSGQSNPYIATYSVFVVQYWVFCIPMTLLSAFLLLSKRRPRKSPRPAKPSDEAQVTHA